MKRLIALLLLSIGAAMATGPAEAAAPTCGSHSSGSYCQYSGKVHQAYINAQNRVILYFDTAMDSTLPANVGISGVTVFNAAAFDLNTNSEFGKALYASMLSAQARDAMVRIQMRGVDGGYLQIDRIWVLQ